MSNPNWNLCVLSWRLGYTVITLITELLKKELLFIRVILIIVHSKLQLNISVYIFFKSGFQKIESIKASSYKYNGT